MLLLSRRVVASLTFLWTSSSTFIVDHATCNNSFFYSSKHQFKILSVVFYRQEIYAVHDNVLRLTKSVSGEAEDIFYQFNMLFEKIGKLVFVLYVGVVFTFILNPVISYAATGKIEPMFNVHFPGMDNDTVTGYIVNAIGSLLVMVNSCAVFAAADVWTCYYFLFTGIAFS